MKTIFNSGKRVYFILLSAIIILTIAFVMISSSLTRASLSDDCLMCHEDKDLTMDKNGRKVSLYINPSAYKNSRHGGFDCRDCHEKYNPEAIPHNPNKKDIDCKSCHGDLKMSAENVHSQQKCYSCHDPHKTLSASELKASQSGKCLSCHKTKNVQGYTQSIHANRNVGCESCHQGGHQVKKISKGETAQLCGKCHGSHQRNFDNSVHETVLKSGNKNAPTCTDCHGYHKILTSKMSIESQGCLKCHLNEKLFPGEGRGSAKFVSEYKTSIHTSIQKNGQEAASCSDCHGNHMIQNPDDPKSSTTKTRLPETCGKCHADIIDKFEKSAHGMALKEKLVAAPTCISCHNEHSIKSVHSSDEFSKLNQVDMCLNCHLEGKLPHKNYKGEEVLISHYKNSFHYMALQNGNTNAATCSDCHGSHEMKKFDDPTSKIFKKNIPFTCGQSACHTKQLAEYTGSIHEVSLMTKEKSDAPTCTNCHGNHQILKRDDKGNLISNPKGLVQLCSDCHSSVELVRKYDLPLGKAETYLESFHGLAIRGGSKVAANCESCHGYHNIKPSSDSTSTINKKNLPVTCGKCHPGASQTLFTTKIHTSEKIEDSPILYWIKVFYLSLIFGTIGGMAIHNIFDIIKKVQYKNRHK